MRITASASGTMSATTTAYSNNQNVLPGNGTPITIAIPANATGWDILYAQVWNNDTTNTAWPGNSIELMLFSSLPTFSGGDRTTFGVTVGSGIGGYIGSMFGGFLPPVSGQDGYAGVFAPVGVGILSIPSTVTNVYAVMRTVNTGGVTGASKVWTVQLILGTP